MAVLTGAAALSCATPYQSKGFRGGYSSQQVGPDTHAISVETNSLTSSSTAMAYAYRRASELCPLGYDPIDRAASQSDFYTAYGNTVQNMPKASVSLIVRCRRPALAAPPVPRPPEPEIMRPEPTAVPSAQWWCSVLVDEAGSRCERSFGACDDMRVRMASTGSLFDTCHARESAWCTRYSTTDGIAIALCTVSAAHCRKFSDYIRGLPGNRIISECELM